MASEPKPEEDYEAIGAFETLLRAEEIKRNKKLMVRMKKYAKMKKAALDALNIEDDE